MPLFIKRLLARFKTDLPVGLTEFHRFADEVIELAGPYADPDSMKWAIANMILHLDSKVAAVSKAYIVNCLRKAAANQVASGVFQEIKTKQAEAMKALKDEEEKLKAAAAVAMTSIEKDTQTVKAVIADGTQELKILEVDVKTKI